MSNIGNALVLCLLSQAVYFAVGHLRQPVAVVKPAPHDDPDPGPVCNGNDVPDVVPARLCRDFRDMRDLIPANTLVYITSKHFYSDTHFQRAMQFIQTPEFASISQQIAESSAYEQALKRFADAGVNTTSIASIASMMNCLLLPMPVYGDVDQTNASGMDQLIVPRSVESFATEIMKAIPRQELSALISQKLIDSKEFAAFYKIARSPGFRSQVLKGLNSYELQYPLSVLKRNCIDLRKLTTLAFKILSWGPRYY